LAKQHLRRSAKALLVAAVADAADQGKDDEHDQQDPEPCGHSPTSFRVTDSQSYFPTGVAAKPLRAGQGMSTSVTRETVVRRAT
jgi:hypothetical protein